MEVVVMEEMNVPLIIRMQQAWAIQPKPLGPRPTWESSITESAYGLLDLDAWRWWRRTLFRLSGGNLRWLPPFLA